MGDITASIAGVKLENPTVLASGIMGVSASSLALVAGSGAGAVTMKSMGPEKRAGHPNPVVANLPYGLLNAVGLSCPPIEESIEELKKAVKRCSTPVIASIYGNDAEEFGEVAERVSEARPALLEANISCPNVEGKPFGTDPDLAAKVVEAVKDKTRIPLSVKLTPNVADIVGIARAVEAAGADAITAINTYGPGMAINIEAARPVLSNKWGGLSGPAIKPLAIRCVYQIYEAVEVPIIGVGGVSDGRDAVEMLMAGASAVGIGTAVLERDLSVFSEVCREIREFMEKESYSRLSELKGRAHER